MANKGSSKYLERCFACGRVIRSAHPKTADTRDGQIVFVGIECHRLIENAGDAGYQPPKGGPRLYPINRSEEMKLWTISRNGAFVGTLRAKTREAAIKEYAEWAKCDPTELEAA